MCHLWTFTEENDFRLLVTHRSQTWTLPLVKTLSMSKTNKSPERGEGKYGKKGAYVLFNSIKKGERVHNYCKITVLLDPSKCIVKDVYSELV